MQFKRTLALIPSAYSEAAVGDIENFVDYYKEKFEVFIIVDRVIDDDIENTGGIHIVQKGTKIATYLLVTADYIIDAGAAFSRSKNSSLQKRVSVWHGTPYKKMFAELSPRHAVTAINYAKKIDLMVSPSKWYTEEFLRKSMLYEGEVLETAISRTDSLFISDEKKEEIRKRFGIKSNEKVMLYAPTFREEGAFVIPFSPKEINRVLGDNWKIVVKTHYLNYLKESEGIIDAGGYPSINNLMAVADLMITDYSSVLFDYSVLDKPALLYQYDRDDYEEERSFMFDMEDYVDSRDIVTDEARLYNRLKDFDSFGANLLKVRNEFYPHQKPGATADLVNELGFDDTTRRINEVIFLVNHLHERGGVHSFITNLARELKDKYNSKIYVFGMTEYNPDNEELCVFDRDDLIDIKMSYEINPNKLKRVLNYTNGYIISCQYSAHMFFQNFLKEKNALLMFHGDTKDIINRSLYSWHLDAINNERIKNYKRLVFLSESNSEAIKKHVKDGIRNKIITIENGQNVDGCKNLYKESGDFALVTRLDHDKNPIEAIEIFATEDINPNFKLHIYGDGPLKEEVLERIQAMNLTDKVFLHGYEESKEVIYNNKQGTISVSLTEGLPLVFLESIKYGIPVYAYDSFTSCRDIIDNNTGVLIETGNQKAFVEALNTGFDIRNFSNEEILEKFSNETVARKWEELFIALEDEGMSSLPLDIGGVKRDKTSKDIKSVIRSTRFFRDNERYARLSTIWNNLKRGKKANDMPLVSIIMPFYNNNDTVKNAIDSVEHCGYRNYEILLVNDGSSEEPRSFIKNKRRVRYYYKENGGLSDTRNFGMDRAKGKYVLFLDSDDTLYPNALNRLVAFAEKHQLSMVSGKTIREYVKTGEREAWYANIYEKNQVNKKKNRRLLIDDTIATGKLYLRDMLILNHIRFKPGLYEDILFTGQLYASLDRIGIISNTVQKWKVYGNNTSITTNRTLENAKARLKNLDSVFEMQKTNLEKVFYTRQYIRHQMISSLAGFAFFSDEEKRESFCIIKDGLNKRKDYIVENLQLVPAKIELYKAVLEDDYDRFSMLATGFSLDQIEGKLKDGEM